MFNSNDKHKIQIGKEVVIMNAQEQREFLERYFDGMKTRKTLTPYEKALIALYAAMVVSIGFVPWLVTVM